MSRLFTFEDAVKMLPRVRETVRQAVDLRSDYQAAEEEMNTVQQRIAMLGGALVDADRILQIRARREASGRLLRQTLESLEELGCLIKDLDVGLVDFPARYRGREVYLCWKLGESEIGWWHGTEEGFAGRKLIDKEFLAGIEGE
ncbi:MAG TPA: DUF2203 domain-containing protein [Bryobacteraceae bacterium]|nr:DUF2203 domain-containing protein [Bryobacteraceae bacterium]